MQKSNKIVLLVKAKAIVKNVIIHIIARFVRNELCWSIMQSTVLRLADFIKRIRRNIDESNQSQYFDIQTAIDAISPDLTVKHGPFKGMIYPERKAVGSLLAPKMLGTYERELHKLFEKICATEYTEIIDIGCAEGYYAVGLAMRIKSAKIYAYDTNMRAISLCKKMAQINNVSERIMIGSFCDANVLRAVPYTKKALIISDCEGYEKELFSEGVATFLAHHDLLIEIHDFMDIEISSYIRQCFQQTHIITTIQSIDDIAKAHTYYYEELRHYSLAERRLLLAEHRPSIMEWFFMTPHTNSL